MSNLYSVGQMNQLGDSLEAEGFTADDVTKLKQYANLAGIKAVLNGTAKIKPVGEDATRTITMTMVRIIEEYFISILESAALHTTSFLNLLPTGMVPWRELME